MLSHYPASYPALWAIATSVSLKKLFGSLTFEEGRMRATVIARILSRGRCGMASAQVVLPNAGEARLARFGRVLTRKVAPTTGGATSCIVAMATMPPGSVLSVPPPPHQEQGCP